MLSWQTKTIALELKTLSCGFGFYNSDAGFDFLERHLTFLSDHLHRSVTPREAQAILKSTRRQITALLEAVVEPN